MPLWVWGVVQQEMIFWFSLSGWWQQFAVKFDGIQHQGESTGRGRGKEVLGCSAGPCNWFCASLWEVSHNLQMSLGVLVWHGFEQCGYCKKLVQMTLERLRDEARAQGRGQVARSGVY